MITLRLCACLLLRVSWLLVALIPGLLMMAAVGLERLESGLDVAGVTAVDVAGVLAPVTAGGGPRYALGPADLAYAFSRESAVSRN